MYRASGYLAVSLVALGRHENCHKPYTKKSFGYDINQTINNVYFTVTVMFNVPVTDTVTALKDKNIGALLLYVTIFKASALWAYAFYKLICPYVCVCVCVFVHF